MFPSPIKIRGANGTFIPNKGECDISFTIGSEKFTFQFLCSDQLSKEIIVGHNFAHALHIGTTWSAKDVMLLTYNGKHLVDILPSNDINVLVYCAERVVIPPYSHARWSVVSLD